MRFEIHVRNLMVMLAVSITLEVTLLAGVFRLNDVLYHGIHLVLMAAVVSSQMVLFFRGDEDSAFRRYALWLGLGALCTGIGDWVNCGLSFVQPVSLKVTWSVFIFGTGYSIYSYALWHYGRSVRKAGTRFDRLRYLIVLLILVLNVGCWFVQVHNHVAPYTTLYYGAFILNTTIYVILPSLAIWNFRYSRQGLLALGVLIGAILLPYSDLILITTWLTGNPPVPALNLYGYNWILYFGGQALFALFPAQVMVAQARS
ncbi:MAG TPA: hypothetical protein PK344_06570 [Syntrophorhabdaceae bacterium]|nr:hypothetical protein [Syntrophorhabdaceae bacterium]HPA07244.1 hypothetical protein [Methanoregulaceae archaeon]